MTSSVSVLIPHSLSAKDRLAWFRCVQDHVPSGMVASTQLMVDDGSTHSRYYVIKQKQGWRYVVPLARDLQLHEAHAIVQAWCKAYPKGDFEMDYSQPVDHVKPQSQDVPDQKIAQVMDAWCKIQHDAWMQERLKKGWRYGVRISLKDRTHPWLQPYESLPAVARSPHVQAVKDLLSILNDFGYTIKQKPQA